MKKSIIISIILLGIIVFYMTPKESNNNLNSSNINNNLDGIAFYVQTEEGSKEYNNLDTIPSKDDGYVFKEAVCSDSSTVTFNSSRWSLKIGNMEDGRVRCRLYFDIDTAIAREYILAQNTVNEGTPDFSTTATTNEGIFMAEDDYGTSYYYRGDVDNNYFYFAGYYWRIIRINGDGTIRLIYQGTSADATGSNANALSSAWSSSINDNAYIGYMYGNPGSSTYEETHANINDSTIKTSIDNWYQNNLINYEEYIADSGFCGDRELSSGTGIGSSQTTYLSNTRLSNYEPTFKCSNENDLYTLANATNGNKALTYPIGLITADEVAYAGAVTTGTVGEANYRFYLYTGTTWRTMTPQSYGIYNNVNNPKVFGVDGEGILRWFQGSAGAHGVRPVINIKKDVKLAGKGTKTNPYRIRESELELCPNGATGCYTILANNTVNYGTPNFDETSTANEGVFVTEDDYGTSYYFRGAIENNYVKFAGFYWRIIRINGDGSIRLIYDGTSAHSNGESSSERQIGSSSYASAYYYSYYVGYTYTAGMQRPTTQNGGTASVIKEMLDNWYNTNLLNYDDIITNTSGYCNDRSVANGYSWAERGTFYSATWNRLVTNKTPTLKCSNSLDLYTTKIGLITIDEASMAGSKWPTDNEDYYLFTGTTYWTISPSNFLNNNAFTFTINLDGSISEQNISSAEGVRPVINLKPDVTLSGSGTQSDPYTVS